MRWYCSGWDETKLGVLTPSRHASAPPLFPALLSSIKECLLHDNVCLSYNLHLHRISYMQGEERAWTFNYFQHWAPLVYMLLRDSEQSNGCFSSLCTLLGVITSTSIANIYLKKCDGGTRTYARTDTSNYLNRFVGKEVESLSVVKSKTNHSSYKKPNCRMKLISHSWNTRF